MSELIKKIFNLSKFSKIYKLLGLIIICVIFYYIYKNKENLENTSNTDENTVNEINQNNNSLELKQDNPTITPMSIDKNTGIITAGSEFIGLPTEIIPAWGNTPITNYGQIDKLDDGYNGNMGLNYNKCSKSCCGNQYPPPFKLEDDDEINKIKDELVPNNYACSNSWNNSGCVCMTKQQHNYLSSRGKNAE